MIAVGVQGEVYIGFLVRREDRGEDVTRRRLAVNNPIGRQVAAMIQTAGYSCQTCQTNEPVHADDFEWVILFKTDTSLRLLQELAR